MMQKFMDSIREMTLSVAIAVGLVVGALYYFLIFDEGTEIEDQIQNLKATNNANKSKLERTQKAIANGDSFEKDFARMGLQYKKALSYLPNEMSISELMRVISLEAKSAGSNLVKVTPGQKVEKRDFYEELSIDVVLEGTFGELMSFLVGISHVPRILSLQKLLLTTKQFGPEGPMLSIQTTIVGYRYIPTEEGSAKESKATTDGQSTR